ncbi:MULTISPECIES: hypothetical protein [Bradyrhizobium]|uniref:hypothetical protein n=1 Tax=Bradyrhizobium TaxID=374 RepID=UPI001BA9A384|nr:hypothetical protein [Bradyrhizobium liaoningense]MBR0983513.1 hypothetical protein [Bradyrhizobium liaoningense]
MSSDQGLDRDGNPKPPNMRRVAHFFGVVFAGTLLIGILATIAFSASGCLLSRVIRCFSISRDAAGVALLGFKMWSLPALIAGALVAAIIRFRGNITWWNVLLVAPASYLVLALLFIRRIDQYMLPELLVQSVLLFVCVQLSLFVGRMAYRVRA